MGKLRILYNNEYIKKHEYNSAEKIMQEWRGKIITQIKPKNKSRSS